MAVVAALLCRQMGGPGQFIDAAIHDAIAHSTEGTVPRYIFNARRSDPPPSDADSLRRRNVPERPGLAARRFQEGRRGDGARWLYAKTPKLMAKADPNQFEELPEMLARWAAARPAMEAFKALQECGLAAGAVRYPEDMIDDPHCAARENFVAIEHPELGRTFLYPRQPRQQATTPWRWGPRAPLLGEHTGEIRRELGLDLSWRNPLMTGSNEGELRDRGWMIGNPHGFRPELQASMELKTFGLPSRAFARSPPEVPLLEPNISADLS